jgi:hypothetical protein
MKSLVRGSDERTAIMLALLIAGQPEHLISMLITNSPVKAALRSARP